MVDARVKERLTGAVILVALLVLLVPELLSGPGSSAGAASPPSGDGQQMRSYTIDLADDGSARRSASTPAASIAPPAASPANAASDVGTEAERDALPAATTASADAPAPLAPPRTAPIDSPPRIASSGASSARTSTPLESRSASARTSAGGWAVQVGSFASRENAERLARELKGKGFESHVSESSGNGKRLWRVRVGSEPDRASAVALGARLRASGQSGGSVVPVP
jgi:DedD protein